MEISVGLPGDADAQGLLRRLESEFPATVALDDALREIWVLPGDEPEGAVIRVVDVVGRWLEQGGAPSARLSVGDRSCTLLAGGQIASPR